MSRTLFLGDSHSCGYYVENHNDVNKAEPVFWSKNNYAEVYSKVNKKPVIIYAIPAGCNKKYPTWLKAMFDYYPDIDEVFIQSTYWNRHLLGVNKYLDLADGLKPNHFSHGPNPPPASKDDPLIERWADVQVTDKYIEIATRTDPKKINEYKGFNLNELSTGMQDLFANQTYEYTKLWHEHITHLQYKEYCGDLFIIDNLCKQYSVKWHLWSINDRVVIPSQLDFYGSLNNCIRPVLNAEQWIKQHHGIEIEKHTLDGEHYTKEIHNIIGKEYIPYVKNN